MQLKKAAPRNLISMKWFAVPSKRISDLRFDKLKGDDWWFGKALLTTIEEFCALHMTDGFISHDQLDRLTAEKKRTRRVAGLLADAGLLKRFPNGFRAEDYAENNRTSAEYEKEKTAKSASQARRRQNKKNVGALQTGDISPNNNNNTYRKDNDITLCASNENHAPSEANDNGNALSLNGLKARMQRQGLTASSRAWDKAREALGDVIPIDVADDVYSALMRDSATPSKNGGVYLHRLAERLQGSKAAAKAPSGNKPAASVPIADPYVEDFTAAEVQAGFEAMREKLREMQLMQ